MNNNLYEERDNLFITCPRCKQLIKEGCVCDNCGFSVDSNENQTEILNFGLNTASIAVNSIDEENTYKQATTPKIRKYQLIVNIILLLVGVFGCFLFFLPLFARNNFISNFETIAKLYKIEFDTNLLINNGTNLIALLQNISKFPFVVAKEFTPLYAMYWYEVVVMGLTLIEMCLSVVVVIFAVRNLTRFENSKRYRTLLEIILIIVYFMMFGLNAIGIGTIILAVLSTSCFIMFYVCEIVSKEKKFIPRLLIYKSITFVVFVALLIVSNVGLVRLNVTLGSNLFTYADADMSAIYGENVTFICRGLFYEFAALIQCCSGDVAFTTKVFIFDGFATVFHCTYLVCSAIAAGQLLKSISKQNVKFPMVYIIIAVGSFYMFSMFTIATNYVINAAFYTKYTTYKTIEDLIVPPSFQVFFLRGGMIGSMILNGPALAFSIIANKECVNKVYR